MTTRPFVYLDHAATTPCDPVVVEAMLPFFTENFGNPSGVYAAARRVRQAIDAARDQAAALLGAASPSEVIFTSGGTEADNLAVFGVALAARERGEGRHIVTTAIEHQGVLNAARALENQGFAVTYVPPEANGIVPAEGIVEALTDETVLVSVMLANNEVGTIQPVREIAAVCRERGIPLHTDAVQAVGHMPINVQDLGVDLLSLSAHKFYGPKGVGALYVRKGIELAPHIHGGGQELERRAGTENVAGIIGLAKALELAVGSLDADAAHMQKLRDTLIEAVLTQIPGSTLNGDRIRRLPGNAHFSFDGVDGESLLLNLDMHGIAASAGSACSAGSVEPSYVLLAMGVDREQAKSAVRLTLGRHTRPEDIDYVVGTLKTLVEKLRGTGR